MAQKTIANDQQQEMNKIEESQQLNQNNNQIQPNNEGVRQDEVAAEVGDHLQEQPQEEENSSSQENEEQKAEVPQVPEQIILNNSQPNQFLIALRDCINEETQELGIMRQPRMLPSRQQLDPLKIPNNLKMLSSAGLTQALQLVIVGTLLGLSLSAVIICRHCKNNYAYVTPILIIIFTTFLILIYMHFLYSIISTMRQLSLKRENAIILYTQQQMESCLGIKFAYMTSKGKYSKLEGWLYILAYVTFIISIVAVALRNQLDECSICRILSIFLFLEYIRNRILWASINTYLVLVIMLIIVGVFILFRKMRTFLEKLKAKMKRGVDQVKITKIIFQKQIIERMEVKIFKPETILNDENSCIICLDEFSENDEYLQLTCQHAYHKLCILEWFKNRNFCPYCRQKIQ